jgi:hypothetical protein
MNLVRKPEGKRLMGHLDVHGRMILKCLNEIAWDNGSWFNVAQVRDNSYVILIKVTKLRVP